MSSPDSAPTPSVETLRLIHDEISTRANQLDTSTSRIDTKATTLLGFVLAACTFLATQQIAGWWKVAPYAVFVASAYFGIQAMRPRSFKSVPEPDVLLDEFPTRSEECALMLLAKAKAQAVQSNRATHEQKAKAWRRALAGLVLATILMVAALIIGGFDGRRVGQSPPVGATPVSSSAVPTN